MTYREFSGGRRVEVCVEGVDGCGVEGVAREGLGRPESAQRRGRGGRSPTTTTHVTSAGPRPNSTSLRLPALLLPRLELNFLLAEAAINSEVKRGGGVGAERRRASGGALGPQGPCVGVAAGGAAPRVGAEGPKPAPLGPRVAAGRHSRAAVLGRRAVAA